MPNPTDAQRHKLNRDPVSDPHVVLLEFQEDGQSAVQRAAINTEDITFEGNLFTAASIDIQLPETKSGDTRARLVASNVDRILGRALDAATQRISVRIILIDTANPTVTIVDTENQLVIPSASGNSTEISAQLGPRATLQEPLPSKRTTKEDFPGIWLA